MIDKNGKPIDEALDKNKSPLTLKITAGAEKFLADRGFKPVETEVPIEKLWTADIASVIDPTETELQKLKLIEKKPTFHDSSANRNAARKKYGNQYWLSPEYLISQEYKDFNKCLEDGKKKLDEWRHRCMSIQSPLTVIVEVKTTHGDFQNDNKWFRPAPSNLRYLAIPSGMLKRSEYPTGWGILEFGADGSLHRIAQNSNMENIDAEKRMWTIHEIALKRHHRTEYVWLRDMRKKMTAQQTASKYNNRVQDLLRAIMDILDAGGYYKFNSVEECLNFRNISFNNLEPDTQDKLNQMWGINKNKKIYKPLPHPTSGDDDYQP